LELRDRLGLRLRRLLLVLGLRLERLGGDVLVVTDAFVGADELVGVRRRRCAVHRRDHPTEERSGSHRGARRNPPRAIEALASGFGWGGRLAHQTAPVFWFDED
jgi:hypothetical protein